MSGVHGGGGGEAQLSAQQELEAAWYIDGIEFDEDILNGVARLSDEGEGEPGEVPGLALLGEIDAEVDAMSRVALAGEVEHNAFHGGSSMLTHHGKNVSRDRLRRDVFPELYESMQVAGDIAPYAGCAEVPYCTRGTVRGSDMRSQVCLSSTMI